MASTTACPSSNPEGETRNMEIKIKGLVRRQMVYGFVADKDAEGEIVGSSVVKLAGAMPLSWWD